MLYTLAFIAVVFTIAMFATKRAEFGFPCGIWWSIFGGHCYTLYVNAWVDIEYFMFFGAFGMAIFSMLAAFGLREKLDTIADEEMEKGDGDYIDEGYQGEEKTDSKPKPEKKERRRTRELRERAERRRTGEKAKRY